MYHVVNLHLCLMMRASRLVWSPCHRSISTVLCIVALCLMYFITGSWYFSFPYTLFTHPSILPTGDRSFSVSAILFLFCFGCSFFFFKPEPSSTPAAARQPVRAPSCRPLPLWRQQACRSQQTHPVCTEAAPTLACSFRVRRRGCFL